MENEKFKGTFARNLESMEKDSQLPMRNIYMMKWSENTSAKN